MFVLFVIKSFMLEVKWCDKGCEENFFIISEIEINYEIVKKIMWWLWKTMHNQKLNYKDMCLYIPKLRILSA